MALDIKKLAAKAKKTGRDFTKTTTGGGGEYTPPAAGPCNLRFVGYFEIGLQKKTFKGAEKKVKQVQLVFELSGKNHPPKVLDDGTKLPIRMTITETDSSNVKANIIKLFNKMNYEGKATHFAELLGNAYRGRVYHTEKENDGNKIVYANLRNEDGYTITPPVVETVDDDGNVETKPVKVAEPLTELKLFLWDNPDKEQWDSIYIDGEIEAVKDEKTGKIVKPARSKNVIQNKIRAALNWEGSPMQLLLEDGDLETDDTEGNEDPVDEHEEDTSDDDAPPPSKGAKAASKAKAAKETAAKKPAATTKKKPKPEPDTDDSTDDDDDPLSDIE
ncbi:conserved hypothetical protein [Burkholderia phage Bp-AMP2]|uniref:Uncharacterized protein n=3 Tax=Ampunavirus BpAMP1 TaxID=2733589 RepID=A0A0A8KWV5_9CAUD|nr:conserved hypothetical protein [Burkholderia phage Bp-AMP2]CDL65217.1 conserved hypothetical protein [Burkholderia phage Bp-AMP3]CDL65255.1 hypothetical protein [Burkholderia phage Bp-AMP4]